jgi:phage/plasmid-associated DNA primase
MVTSFEKSTKTNPFNGRPRSGKIVPEYIPSSDDWGVVEGGVTAPKQPTTVLETADWLIKSLGISPVPNCPAKAVEFGKAKRAKSPMHVAKNDKVYSDPWQDYQDCIPPLVIRNDWWDKSKNKNAHHNGIGAIANSTRNSKRHFIRMIDTDAKDYADGDYELKVLAEGEALKKGDKDIEDCNFTQEERDQLYAILSQRCKVAVDQWEEDYPILKLCPCAKTPNGGYRHFVALENEDPLFKNLSTFNHKPGQDKKHGEIVQHSLLPPSRLADGNSYYWERWFDYPPVIDNYESIGLYPTLKASDKISTTTPAITSAAATQSIKTETEVKENKTEFDQLIKDINANLELEEAFNWEGHNFIEEKGNNGRKLKGNCPWHESSSGTAFYCERSSDGNLVFNCPTCGGGNVFRYRHSLNSNSLLPKPRGKAFTGILRELAGEAGLDCGFLDKPKKVKKRPPLSPDIDGDGTIHCKNTAEQAINELILNKEKYTVINDAFYKYEDGYWQNKEDTAIQHLIAESLKLCYKWVPDGDDFKKSFYFYTDSKLKSSFNICRRSLYRQQDESNRFYRCFNNCVVDLRTGEILEHNKKYLLTSKINANYTPGSDCPETFKKFIISSFGEEYLTIIRAIISLYLDPSGMYGYFLYLKGDSGSGKGTLMRFLASLFSKVSANSSFSDVATPERRHQRLTGSEFCYFPDMSGGYHSGLEAFYELIDNGLLDGRALYSSTAYSTRWNCRFAIGSVDWIRVENSQGGWQRRALVIPCKPANPDFRDEKLGEKLENCKNEVISWCMALDRGLRDKQIKQYMLYDESLKILQREQETTADPISAFIDMCLRPFEGEQRGSQGTGVISPNLMYQYYKAFCNQFGYKSERINSFKNKIKDRLYQFYQQGKQVTKGNKRVREESCFVRIVPYKIRRNDDLSYATFTAFTDIRDGSTQYRCNSEHCNEGGLELFEAFSKHQANNNQELIKNTSAQDTQDKNNPTHFYPVQSGTIATVEFKGTAQDTQDTQHKSLVSNQKLKIDQELTGIKNNSSLERKFSPEYPEYPVQSTSNNGGVRVSDCTGYNFKEEIYPEYPVQLGELGDRTIEDLTSQIKVVDPREQKQQEFTQEQLAEEQIIENIKSQILGFKSSKDHLDLKRNLEFNDGKVLRAIRAWLIKGVKKDDGTKDSILPREFVDIWLG